MKLYGSYTSPFVRHCRIALAEGGLDFEFVETDYQMSAERSPTSKVPFFEDGDLVLTDSSSIVKYAREKSGRAFLKDIDDFELYSMANTLLDTAINLFLLENEGVDVDSIPYLGRQTARIESGLAELDRRIDPAGGLASDSALRTACFIDWALFRSRLGIDDLDNLPELLKAANQNLVFLETAPPGRHG